MASVQKDILEWKDDLPNAVFKKNYLFVFVLTQGLRNLTAELLQLILFLSKGV
jgi:hypothetical protein